MFIKEYKTICICLCQSIYTIWSKYYWGTLIDNRKYAPVYFPDDIERESKQNLKKTLKIPLVVSVLWNTSIGLHRFNRK